MEYNDTRVLIQNKEQYSINIIFNRCNADSILKKKLFSDPFLASKVTLNSHYF